MMWTVREAEPADGVALQAFMAELIAERLPVLHSRDSAPSLVEEVAFIEQMASEPRSKLFVAVAEVGKVVGMLDFHAERRVESAHGGQLGMSVARELRHCGVGRALLHALFAWAPDAGITRLELQVFGNNTAAIELYERAGFEHEGRRRRAVRTDGKALDVLLMAKDVSALSVNL